MDLYKYEKLLAERSDQVYNLQSQGQGGEFCLDFSDEGEQDFLIKQPKKTNKLES